MTSLKTSIMLDRLFGASIQTGQDGKRYISIPVEDNGIFISEKGHAYLSVVQWLNKTGPDQKGNTHMVKLDLSKDFLAQHPELNGQTPAIGNSKPIIPRSQQMPPQNMPYQSYPAQGYPGQQPFATPPAPYPYPYPPKQ